MIKFPKTLRTHIFLTPFFLTLLGVSAMSQADIVTKTLNYQYDGTTFRGTVIFNDAIQVKRPGILVLHEWWGVTEALMTKARRLANEGYVAFVADLYGEARSTEHPAEAGKMMQELISNKEVWRGRSSAALNAFKLTDEVDPSKIAAVGFCLGGNTAFQMVYANFDIVAGIAFHSTLVVPDARDKLRSKARILALQGAQDPMVPKGGIEAFTSALGASNLSWQLNLYPAEHAFTNPKADSKNVPGLKYNQKVYDQSWRDMHQLLSAIFN